MAAPDKRWNPRSKNCWSSPLRLRVREKDQFDVAAHKQYEIDPEAFDYRPIIRLALTGSLATAWISHTTHTISSFLTPQPPPKPCSINSSPENPIDTREIPQSGTRPPAPSISFRKNKRSNLSFSRCVVRFIRHSNSGDAKGISTPPTSRITTPSFAVS